MATSIIEPKNSAVSTANSLGVFIRSTARFRGGGATRRVIANAFVHDFGVGKYGVALPRDAIGTIDPCLVLHGETARGVVDIADNKPISSESGYFVDHAIRRRKLNANSTASSRLLTLTANWNRKLVSCDISISDRVVSGILIVVNTNLYIDICQYRCL